MGTDNPCSKKHGKYCSAYHANIVQVYRDERRRQEELFENDLSYASDAILLKDRVKIITFKDVLKCQG